MIGVGLVSVGLAQLIRARWAPPAAGFVYFLIGPAQYLNGRRFDRRRERLAEGASAAAGERIAGGGG